MKTKTTPQLNPVLAMRSAPSYRYDPQTKTLYKYSKEHKGYIFACSVPYTVKSAITAIRHYESREAMRELKWG